MLFNSFQFFLFFILVTGLFFALSHRYRWLLLLIASCYFYMAFVPVYILILGFTIVIDYFAAVWMERIAVKHKRSLLIASIIANIGVLAVFKYYNFLNNIITDVLQLTRYDNPIPYLSILLPIGLSFHTFQAMSYTIEVYRGNQKAEKHFGIYALYVMFYPQLVAGPIERPQNILHQFYEVKKFDYERVKQGLILMLWGLFKKVVIADRLAIVVNNVFDSPYNFNGLQLITASVFFSFQIFCDFSGYSDIAIGAARVMGFKLMTNFNRPYSAKTISEFWKRWHISLSTWFKDYLYIPMGGNRVMKWKWYYNLFITFVISGLWHGANWTFIVWGILHGFYMVVENATVGIRKTIINRLQLNIRMQALNLFSIFLTFVLVSVAWIFFRAESIEKAFYIISHLGSNWSIHNFHNMGIPEHVFYKCLLLIVLLETTHRLTRNKKVYESFTELPKGIQWILCYAVILLILFTGVFEHNAFIYFQF